MLLVASAASLITVSVSCSVAENSHCYPNQKSHAKPGRTSAICYYRTSLRRVRLASLARKTQRNLCPNAELAFRASRAAMQIHDRFYNREAETVTGRVGTTGRIRPIKSVKNPWQMFRPDPTAVVLS